MATTIKDVDRGYRELMRTAKRGRTGHRLTLGIHKKEGAEKRGKASLAQIALYNEFGTARIPMRSWLRAWVDENRMQIARDIQRALERAVDPNSASSIEDELNKLGLKYVGQIQQRIANGIEPPNAPSTEKRKGSTKPLIDSGQFRQSIRHKVQTGGKAK